MATTTARTAALNVPNHSVSQNNNNPTTSSLSSSERLLAASSVLHKRAGRKPAQTEPSNKRAAQNRAAQRAFRERKDTYVKELEERVRLLEKEKKEALLQRKQQQQQHEQGGTMVLRKSAAGTDVVMDAGGTSSAAENLRLRGRVKFLQIENEMLKTQLSQYLQQQQQLHLQQQQQTQYLALPAPATLATNALALPPATAPQPTTLQFTLTPSPIAYPPIPMQLPPPIQSSVPLQSSSVPIPSLPMQSNVPGALPSIPMSLSNPVDVSYLDLPQSLNYPSMSTTLPLEPLYPSLLDDLSTPLTTCHGMHPHYFDVPQPSPSPFSFSPFQPNTVSPDASPLHGFNASDVLSIAVQRNAISHVVHDMLDMVEDDEDVCTDPVMTKKAVELIEDESALDELCELFKLRGFSEQVKWLQGAVNEACRKGDRVQFSVLVRTGREQRKTLQMNLKSQIPSLAPIIAL
ncbi:hypothetical protein BJ742DRAFT_771457 [Cladochytrium replicatum]|nr:hypothetical protein BJ742DRAFT_771457 [Cladochytrium replicatum]